MTLRPRNAADARLRILDVKAGAFLFGAWRNVSVFFWLGPLTVHAVERLERVTEPLFEQHKEGISNVHVLVPGVPMPDSDVRDALLELMRRRAAQRACLSVVLGGGGFWASTLRSFVTGMRLVSPRSFPLGVHTTFEEVADWLPKAHQERTGITLTRVEVLDALERAERFSCGQISHYGRRNSLPFTGRGIE